MLFLSQAVLFFPSLAVGWTLVVEQGKVDMALPDIRASGWEVSGSTADVLPSIIASGDSAEIEFSPGSLVLTERLAYTGSEQALVLEDLRADISDLTLTLDYGAPGDWPEWISVRGRVNIQAGRFEHPLLAPQPWSFQGKVEGLLEELRIEGILASDSGLEVELRVQLNRDNKVRIAVDAVIDGQSDIRALQKTFTGWPELLTVDSGSARVSAEFRLASETGLEIESSAELDNVSGLFDRTAFSGVEGGLLVSMERGRITARARELGVEELNPGIALNAIQVTADYRAPVASPLDGRLTVDQASARFLEGSLGVPSGSYDLQEGSGNIPVKLQDLSLARLMEVYPAEGLEGSGLLSGHIPVNFNGDRIQVEQGRVSARAPGGRLQLPADKLQAVLGTSQTMDLVIQALQNFHYSALTSTIDYDESGKLTLDLSLEGENPEIQGGHPVILNVNLEDDIPALLRSLQLSGRVNEVVTERVRKLLQQSDEGIEP